MLDVSLPGPVIYLPSVPAEPGDPFGAMPEKDMTAAIAAIDVVAAIATAAGLAHLDRAFGRRAPHRAYRCCAGALVTAAHLSSFEHVAHRCEAMVEDATTYAALQRGAGAQGVAARQVARGEVLDRCKALAGEVCAVLDALRSQSGFDESRLRYLTPFLALDVPARRVGAYESAGLTWPQALTFETYGPPDAEDLAHLVGVEPSRPVPWKALTLVS